MTVKTKMGNAMTIVMKPSLIALAVACCNHGWAMDSLSDEDLTVVTGQDGIQIGLSAPTGITADRVYWADGDPVTTPTALDLRLETVKITPLTATLSLDFGADNTTSPAENAVPAMAAKFDLGALRLTGAAMRIANNTASTRSFGVYAIDAPHDASLSFFNKKGIFDGSSAVGKLTFFTDRSNWYLAQARCLYAGGCAGAGGLGSGAFNGDGNLDGSATSTQNGDYNILMFRDLTMNVQATGKFSVDSAKGLNFTGTLSFPRYSVSQAGFQVDIGTVTNVDFSSSGPGAFNFANVAAAIANPAIIPNQGRHWRFGFSGDLPNTDISMIGDNGAAVLTEATAGTSGLKLRPKFSFAKNTGDGNEFILELGEPVTTAAGVSVGSSVRFSNWQALVDTAGDNRATFDMGDIYINLLPPGNGTTYGMKDWVTPASAGSAAYNTFACSSGAACSSNVTNFGKLLTNTGAGENSVAVGIRGFSLQGGARTINFYNTDTGASLATTQNWALLPTLYNLNANLLMYPSGHPSYSLPSQARHGTGFDLTVETTGKDTAFGTDGNKGTHLLVADTSSNTYVGYRNLDGRYSFKNSQLYAADKSMDFATGSGLDVDGLRMTSDMSYDLRAGMAVGTLPTTVNGAKIKDNDDIIGQRWKFGGKFSFTFSPPPDGESYIGMTSTLDTGTTAADAAKNGLYFAEPVDGTRVEWINMTGKLNMLSQNVIDTNYTDASRLDIGKETSTGPSGLQDRAYFTFAVAYQLDPGTSQTQVVRINDLNLYRPPNTNAVFTCTAASGVCAGAGAYKQGVDWRPGWNLDGTAPGISGNTTGTVYRLGEMVMTGGRFYTALTLKTQ